MRVLSATAMVVLMAGCLACRSGWVELNNECFKFDAEKREVWGDAMILCLEHGGEIATIRDANTLRAIYLYLLEHEITDSFWIGGSDEKMEGMWMWHDDTLVDHGTPFWAIHPALVGWAHEPSGGRDANCLFLDAERKHYYNDGDCNMNLAFICSA